MGIRRRYLRKLHRKWAKDPLVDVVPRSTWGAVEPLAKKTLPHPISCISTVPEPRVEPCSSAEECTHRLRDLQQRCMTLDHQHDIRANFYVDDTGKIYEGRGWFNQPPDHPIKKFTGQYIEIAHIGATGAIPPTDAFLQAKKDLIKIGRKRHFLVEYPEFM